MNIRTIEPHELDGWLALSGTRDDGSESDIRSAWTDGSSGPERTFLAQDGARERGRLALVSAPAASSTPDFEEARIVGLWLPWEDSEAVDIGTALLRTAVERLRPPVRSVEGWANPALMPGNDVRRAVFAKAGLPLFQEKEGVTWSAREPDPAPSRAHLRSSYSSVAEVGREPFLDILARTVAATLDRQDRYYSRLMGTAGWAHEMLGYLTDEDAATWLLATDAVGAAVGYVLLGDFDEPGTGTIIHLGVVPEARGRGIGGALLAEANTAARRRGFERVLSDADVENRPMLTAFERAGHHAAATPWHVWHHRLDLPAGPSTTATHGARDVME